jgi:2,3-bisphosphoglycerate-independent phosphoglycerate mutase
LSARGRDCEPSLSAAMKGGSNTKKCQNCSGDSPLCCTDVQGYVHRGRVFIPLHLRPLPFVRRGFKVSYNAFMTKTQTALIILDGWGYRQELKDNAVAAARTPHFDRYWNTYPHTLLEASGLAVGLPEGQMGNSEIGHTTIGAGRALDTDLVRIAKSISNGEFAANPAFVSLFNHVKKYDSTLHVKGLISKGGVHSHQDHLAAFLRAAKNAGIEKIAIHAFTDGRDTPPQSAAAYLKEIEVVLEEVGIGFIATMSGRFYAMDRDNNWDRLAKTEAAIFEGKGHIKKGEKPSEVLERLYTEGALDEHIEPVVFLDANDKSFKVEDNDGIFFFNFRSDRARMLSKKLKEVREKRNLFYVTLTEYDKDPGAEIAFPIMKIETTLAKEISAAGLSQAHIAETEKFPHATYFLNGGVETLYEKEKHILLDSRKDVPTHDLAPKMRAEAIADKAIEEIEAGTDFIFINFANPDMVGHTANVPALIEAIEETDTQLGRVVDALISKKGVALITADHGNAEVNVDQLTGEKHTAHTINPVPCIVVQEGHHLAERAERGTLTDLTPTVFHLLGIPKPASMTGQSLIK